MCECVYNCGLRASRCSATWAWAPRTATPCIISGASSSSPRAQRIKGSSECAPRAATRARAPSAAGASSECAPCAATRTCAPSAAGSPASARPALLLVPTRPAPQGLQRMRAPRCYSYPRAQRRRVSSECAPCAATRARAPSAAGPPASARPALLLVPALPAPQGIRRVRAQRCYSCPRAQRSRACHDHNQCRKHGSRAPCTAARNTTPSTRSEGMNISAERTADSEVQGGGGRVSATCEELADERRAQHTKRRKEESSSRRRTSVARNVRSWGRMSGL